MNRDVLLEHRLRGIGWSVFLVKCADGSYYGGMTRNMKKELVLMNTPAHGSSPWYFKSFPKKAPVDLVFEERHVPFREAFAKKSYLMEMNRTQRDALIRTKSWPAGWLLFSRGVREEPKD